MYAELCDLLHQAICEGADEPDTEPGRGFFTGEIERAFANAICQALDLDFSIHCALCDGQAEPYMVRDDVWAAAGLEYAAGWVCIACLGARLGRNLGRQDFTSVGMNDWTVEAMDRG
jgi:hypothetical protein